MFGIHQIVEDVFLECHLEGHNRLPGEVQGSRFPIEAFESLALHLPEEVLCARRDVVDEMSRECFLLGERLGLAHGTLCAFGVAAALGSDRAHQSCCIIFDLPVHLIVRLDLYRANQCDGMGSTGCGSWCHRGDVSGLKNEDSSRARVAAGGRHVDDNRNGRLRDLFDNLASRADQTARRIHLDQDGLIAAPVRFIDGAGDVFRADWLDGVVHHDFQNLSRRWK